MDQGTAGTHRQREYRRVLSQYDDYLRARRLQCRAAVKTVLAVGGTFTSGHSLPEVACRPTNVHLRIVPRRVRSVEYGFVARGTGVC